MSIGPVQIIVIGFDHGEFHGKIKAELDRLRENDTIRLIDPTHWFDGTPKDRLLRQKYWPQSSPYFVYEVNQAAKVSEYC